jgi:hypothetical protein
MDLADTVAGRRRFMERTESAFSWARPGEAGSRSPEGQSLQSTLRRGWYFGSEAFRERLLAQLGRDDGGLKRRRQRGYSDEQAHDHGVAETRRIVLEAGIVLHIAENEWEALKKGDWRKGLVAGLIRQRSLVDNGWLAEHLHMGARNAVSRTIREARDYLRSHPRDAKLANRLGANVKTF